MQAERRGLESAVLELSGKTTALTRWLAENESKLPEGASHISLPLSLFLPLLSCSLSGLQDAGNQNAARL